METVGSLLCSVALECPKICVCVQSINSQNVIESDSGSFFSSLISTIESLNTFCVVCPAVGRQLQARASFMV